MHIFYLELWECCINQWFCALKINFLIKSMIICIQMQRKVRKFFLKRKSQRENKFLIADQELNCYKIAERHSYIISIVYSTSILAVLFYGYKSLFQTIFLVLVQGKDMEENYVLPFPCVIPYAVNTWARYIFTYLWIDGSYSGVVFNKIIVTSVQFNLCFYAISVMQHLQLKTKNFNQIRWANCVA